jgi:hypothetical protein
MKSDASALFLTGVSGVEHLVNAITSLVAPEMFSSSVAALKYIAEVPGVMADNQPTVDWPSCFSAMELIVNRRTPPHTDAHGSPESYDLLLTGGSYKESQLDVETLGASLCYPPGTVVALAGRALTHAVPTWSGGGAERYCIAHFIRDNVHERTGVPLPHFPVYNEYAQSVEQ